MLLRQLLKLSVRVINDNGIVLIICVFPKPCCAMFEYVQK